MTKIAKHPKETARAYEAYCIFAQLPPVDRNYPEVARRAKASIGTVRYWGRRFNWIERASDRDEEREDSIATIEDNIAQASARRHLDNAQRLQDMGMRELDRLAVLSEQSEIPLIRPEHAIKMMEVGFKMERLLNGESTENNAVSVGLVRPLTPEEIAAHNQYIDGIIVDSTDDND